MQAADIEIVGLTVAVAARAVAFGLPPALAVALLVERTRLPGRSIIGTLAQLPAVLPPVAVGWLLLLLFGIRGPVGAWLERALGIRLVFTATGASLACAVMALPIMIRAIRLSLAGVDRALEAAAATLGAGALDRLVSVTLPLALPGILVAIVTGFTMSLGEFGAVITFAGNVEGVTQTLPLAIYAALQTPDGEAEAARLAGLSLVLAILGLLASDWLSRSFARRLGR